MKVMKKCLSFLLVLVMLTGILPMHFFITASAAEIETEYKVEIESFIRGAVTDLRCGELLEARIYKSTDGGVTWVAVTEVDDTPVSNLSFTWTNTSKNTAMIAFKTHNMASVNVNNEGTFQNGNSTTMVGGRWAAYKTPGVNAGGMGGNWGSGGGRFPGGNWGSGSGSSSSSSSTTFSGTATVQVRLPDGTVISNSFSEFEEPNLSADLNNIALGLFKNDSQSLLDLLGESAIVHITCSTCSVSNVRIVETDGCITLSNNNRTVYAEEMGKATLSMTVDKEGCTVHNGQSATVEMQVYVFRVPETSTTTTTLTLKADSLDSRCDYYINGIAGIKQDDGTIVFTGLTPDTDYTVDVVATYTATDGDKSVTKYAYAYVTDTTKPVYNATVNTYLDGSLIDIADIHGEDVVLYLKAENGRDYIYLPHVGTGTYTADVDNGVYYVYHKENGDYHKISENTLVVANRVGVMAVHHYSVMYDAAGGAFAANEAPEKAIFASGKKVTAISETPTRAGYVFAGWAYGDKVIAPGATVTEAIKAPVRLIALWEKDTGVKINVTVDHTYIDSNGNKITDNNENKDDVLISLVERDNSASPYLEVPNCDLVLSESNHSGHSLFVNGAAANNYFASGVANVTETRYEDGEAPSFTGLSASKEYFVTVTKVNYVATVTATKQENGDWVIDVSLKFNPESEEITFEVNMDRDMPAELYPEAVIVKITYFNEATGKWEIIAQHANGNPGVRLPITAQTGNTGSFSVWAESEEGTPYYYRMAVSAFIYKDGTIVSTTEKQANVIYTDKNFTATVEDLENGLTGAYFNENGAQVGSLKATVKLEAYDVTFNAAGGNINGAGSAVSQNEYYIPDFNQFVPTMEGHSFLGWWYKDANGNYTAKATEGELLTEDITLYALWDQTLEGSITVDGTYVKDGETLTVWDADRATQAIVILQEITSDTVNSIKTFYLPINWNGDIGTSDDYFFEGLDPMKTYRIEVIISNYEAAYQNSTTPVDVYEADDYGAVYTEEDPWETFVNAKLSFKPESYKQKVEVDASQIGETFRPDSVEVEIHYTERGTNNPYQVITQHKDGGFTVLIGADGKQNGLYEEDVWIKKWNGSLYEYQAFVSDSAVLALPVTVLYGDPSDFDTVHSAARNTLTVTLLPNTYDVIFDLNITEEDDEDKITYYNGHTWSHATEINYLPTREGYVFDGWEAEEGVLDENGNISADIHEVITLKAKWKKATVTYKVEYYYNGELKETVTLDALFGDVIATSFEQKVTYNGNTYALDYVVGAPLTVTANNETNVIKVYYGTDNISDADDSENTPDGIPDYYQVTVTFNVVNGTWDDTSDSAAKIRVYTLYERNANNPWDKTEPPAMGALPEGTANEHFVDEGEWSPRVPDTVERDATYTLSFNEPSKYNVVVIVVNGTASRAGLNEAHTSYVYTVTHNDDSEDDLVLEFTALTGYALDYIVVDGETFVADGTALAGWSGYTFENVEKNHTIRVVYATDVVGENNTEESDNIPDKYQKKVTFKVVNGSWDGADIADKVTYLTLTTNGKWAEDGSAELPEVPTEMKANEGFKKGSWDVAEFPETVEGTTPVIYTHTFKPTVYVDYVYTVEHYKQQINGGFILVDTEEIKIFDLELNADENGFENEMAAVSAIAKNYGEHYSEDTNHKDRIATGTPAFGEELTLKLYYELDSHTVRYDLNGGIAENNDYSDASYRCQSTVSVKEAAHKHGYVFCGWKAEDGTVYRVNDVITVDKNIVLTAQWERQTGLSYTVYYLEENTNKMLNQELVVGGMTYGDVVDSRSHIVDIEGYEVVGIAPETLTVDIDASENIIIVYYALNDVGGGETPPDTGDNNVAWCIAALLISGLGVMAILESKRKKI